MELRLQAERRRPAHVASPVDCPGEREHKRANSATEEPPKQRARGHASALAPAGLLLAACALAHSLALGPQPARAAMNLPDGIENILGFVPRSTFQCQRDGYFGDIENDCRIFHLCQSQPSANGRTEWRHWTYACGNQTMFNQLTLTCAFVDEAIPCRHASQFQYLNEVINRPSEPFLTDADVTSGFSYYSNRIMSDGARARAFQDSQLLAQIGGQQHAAAASSPNSLERLQFDLPSGRPSTSLPQATTDKADERGQLLPPQPQQNSAQFSAAQSGGQPDSYSFSFATQHEPSGQSQLHFQQRHHHHHNSQVQAATSVSSPPQLPPVTTTNSPTLFAATAGTTAASLEQTTPSESGPRSATTLSAAESSVATTQNVRSQTPATTQSSASAPFVATFGPTQQTARATRTAQQRRQQQRQQQQTAPQPRRSDARRARGQAFQSTRLSAAPQQAESRDPQQQQALVMRRTSRAVDQPDGWAASGDFWREPSAHLVAPKFESLILRRRV